MQRFSSMVAAWLVRANVIGENDYELFYFAVYSLFFSLAPVALAFAWGIALSMIGESLLMIVPFVLIRKYSGGFHLKSAKHCFIVTTCLLGSSLLFTRWCIELNRFTALSFAVVASTVVICICSPIDSEERLLTDTEQVRFRKIACCMALVMLAIYTFSTGRTSAHPYESW